LTDSVTPLHHARDSHGTKDAIDSDFVTMTLRYASLALIFVCFASVISRVHGQSAACPINASRINLAGIAEACNVQRPDLCKSCICFLGNAINDAGYDVRSPDFNIDACALDNLGVLLDAGATLSAFVKVSNCPRDATMFECVNGQNPPPPPSAPSPGIQRAPPIPPDWLRSGDNSSVSQTFANLETNVTTGSSGRDISKGIVATLSTLAVLMFIGLISVFVAMRCRARRKLEMEGAYIESLLESKFPFTLEMKDVVCTLPNGRVVVNTLTASVDSGSLVGILGPSGCGKTTLMNAIQYGELLSKGSILIDNEAIDTKRDRIACVPQDSYAELVANLTVRETVRVSARLRLPWFLSRAVIDRMTDETIETLGLALCTDSKVGSPMKHTLSGGEARRVSIATELVVDPRVILLDEPTTGLDAFTSSRVIATLRDLSRQEKIVIATVHQPSTKSLQMFDFLIVLSQTGEPMWTGSLASLEDVLIRAEMQAPLGSSTAEWVLEIACDSVLRSKFAAAVTGLDKSQRNISSKIKRDRRSHEVPKSIFTTIQVLLWRALVVTWRDARGLLAHFCVPVAIALILGGLYFNVDNNLEGFQNRMGATFFLLVYFGLSAMSLIDLLNTERFVARAQLRSQFYSHFPYFLSKITTDWLILRMPSSIACSLIFYFMMDLRRSFGAFLVFLGFIALFIVVQSNICAALTFVTKSTGTATLVNTCILLVSAIFSGFLINVKTIPAGAAWVKFVSPFYYAWSGILASEMQGGPYLFNADFDGDLVVLPVSGQTYLEAIGVSYNHVPRNFYAMLALAVATFVLAASAFRFVGRS